MLLTLLALAAPLPALAASDQALEPVTAAPAPAALSVSTSLDSCGVLEDQIVCKLDVSYNRISKATGYSASVTRADGSVVDYGDVAAGGTSLWVPYVGAGNYSVKVTAYGSPAKPQGARRQVLETDVSGAKAKPASKKEKVKLKSAPRARAEASARGQGGGGGEAGGTLEAAPACTETAPPPKPIAPEPLPDPPPEDLDPDNPDEDADGIDDEQERKDYEAAVAEQEAAEAVAETPERVQC